MQRGLRTCLTVALLLASRSSPIVGQTVPTGGKAPEPAKATEAAKPKVTLDKIKLPPGGVVVVVEEVKEALSLLPKMILMSPEEYQKLLDRLAALEKQVKSEKKLAHACKLSGRLEGDFVLLRAEFVFTTEEPWTTVVLGLQGAHLTDEGDLDHKVPFLDFGEEGLSVKVEKEGTHRLTVNLKVAAGFRRSAAASGERGFDLGLPGAAVTTLALDLPAGVREVRCNDMLEKPRRANHWELALGKIKTLTLSWKEHTSLPGTAPLLAADSQIVVKLADHSVLLSADITLEDPRGQTREWRLLLPPGAKVEVKAPAGLGFELLHPEANRLEHLVRLAEASAERVVVNVEVRYPRPFTSPRLPIGPLFVVGADRQGGTIAVYAAPEALRGQRLLFHRNGDIFPRDVPKGSAGSDLAALFKFWNDAADTDASNGSRSHVPLELELKSENSPAEVSVDHFLQVKPAQGGWHIDLTTTLQMKAKRDFLDLQLPRVRVADSGLLGAILPANLPWLPLASLLSHTTIQAVPLDFTCEEDGVKLAPADGRGRRRLTWTRSNATEIKITGKYLVPAGADRLRVDLPRPLQVLDRGGKVRVKVPDQFALVIGAIGSGGPAPLKHEAQLSWDTFPENIDIAWNAHRPELAVAGLTDIRLHDQSAEVTHQLRFTMPSGAGPAGSQTGQVRLRVPATVRGLTVVSGGELILHDAARETAWVLPSGEALPTEIVLHYDFSLPRRESAAPKGSGRMVQVPLVWPEDATRQDAKVRVWSDAGSEPLLVDRLPTDATWDDNGVEVVPGVDVLPALVVHGTALNSPLTLRLVESANARLAALACDRGLIQVAIDEQGTQIYRARYLVTKLNARRLEVEFPMPAADCLLNVWLDKQKINNWGTLGTDSNSAQIPVQPRLYQQPVILEIEYKLPAHVPEGNWFWQTVLYSPQFRGEAFLGQIRWQVTLPYSRVGLVPGGTDYRWGLQGWLLAPEPAVTSAELESWLCKRESTDPPTPVSLVLSRYGQGSVRFWHFSRQLWLLVCSGSLLAIGLALSVLPLARTVFWLLAVGMGIGVLAVGVLWPGWLPALVFGCQPGAFVLVVLLGCQWMLQESYRRRLLFMPGFTRLKANSSLIRSAAAARREPSTVDAPAPDSGPAAQVGQSSNKGT